MLLLQSALLGLVSAAAFLSTTIDAKQTNFIFLLADDWGWGDTGFYANMVNTGEKPRKTPQLDKMAAQGTVFTRFHTLAPVCSPSRASWLSGNSPLVRGIQSPSIYTSNKASNAAIGQADYLNLTTPFLPRVLHNAGYATAHYGKWHLGCTGDAPFPDEYGFDDTATYVSNPAAPQIGNISDVWWPSNSSRVITDKGLEFISNATQAGRPFYLDLWYHMSHAPLGPSDEQLEEFPAEKYCRLERPEINKHCPSQIYRASQTSLDTQLGRVFDFLHENNLAESTLVVFSGDNGPEDHHVYFNSVGSAGIFRGRKRSLYEGGVSVPMIATWPGTIPKGRVSSADLASIDWFPTVASLAGVELDASTEEWLMGQNATDLLLGAVEKAPVRTKPLTWDWRFNIAGYCYHESPRLAIYDLGWDLKLLTNEDGTRTELYNITQDPFEINNIAVANPEKVQELTKMLLTWEATLPQSPPASLVHNPGCVALRSSVNYLPQPDGVSDYELA